MDLKFNRSLGTPLCNSKTTNIASSAAKRDYSAYPEPSTKQNASLSLIIAC